MTAMPIDPEIQGLVAANSFDLIEERWILRAGQPATDMEFFTSTFQALVKKNQHVRAEELAKTLLKGLRSRREGAQALEFVKAGLAVWPGAPVLREALFDLLHQVYADRPSLDRLLQHFKLAEAREPQAALQNVELWLSFDVGRTVLLPSKGLGSVTEINLALTTLRVDFADGAKMSFRMGEAQKLLTALEPGHFLLDKSERLAALQARAEADPPGTLEHLFRSMRRPLLASEIKELCSGVVPDNKWTSWWKKASADPHLSSSGGKRPTYTWAASGEAADVALRAAFEKAAGRERLEMARKHTARSAVFAEALRRGVAHTMQAARIDDPALALEAALTLEKLGATDVDPWAFFAAADPVDLVTGIEDRTLRERAVQLLRERHETWHEPFARLLRTESDTRTLAALYEALSGYDAVALARTVDDVLARPHTAPRFFLWVCREARKRTELDTKADFGLLRKLLDAQSHDAFKSHRAAVRDLFDDGLGEYIADRLTPEQAEQLISLLQREMGLEEHRKEPMRRIVLRKHAALREDDTEKLYTTAEGLERKRAEFEQITRFDIPHNAEQIRIAAAHGDLRENFEYKAARDKHEMLSSRAKTLHDELARARVLEPAAIEPNRVRVGTTVTFKRETGRESKTLTILGPWDSDPANGIVSYLAPAIQPVLGKAPGDAAQFQDGRWLVDTIRVWREV